MPDNFDKYAAWLGITSPQRPVDHYRLLGLPRYEATPESAAAALVQRRQLLEPQRSGPRSMECLTLLGELEAAAKILSNPQHKAAYDAKLRELEKPMLAQAAEPERSGGGMAMIVVLCALVGVCGGGGLITVLVLAYSFVGVSSAPPPPPTIAAAPPLPVPNPQLPPPIPVPQPSVIPSPIQAESLDQDINVIEAFDPARDIFRGRVTKSNNRLETNRGMADMFKVTSKPPANYDLELEFVRNEPPEGVFVGLVVEGRQCMVTLDGFPMLGHRSGIDIIDGKRISDPTCPGVVKGQHFKTGTTHSVLIQVRKNRVAASVDKVKVFDWDGRSERLGLFGLFNVPDRNSVFIGTWDGSFRFSVIQFRPTNTPIEGEPTVR